jgi:hypothetical protein
MEEKEARFVTDEEDLRIVQRFREVNGLGKAKDAA